MMIIPFNTENPEKTYKHYSYAEYYYVTITTESDLCFKHIIYSFIRVYDTFYDSQFNKETVQKYFTGNPDVSKIQLVSDNGYVYTIDLKNDTYTSRDGNLYFIPKEKIFRKEYSADDIRKFVEIIRNKDSNLLKKYSKLVNEDFGSLDKEDIYDLVNIQKEIDNIKPVIP